MLEPTTGIEPVNLFLTKEALYRLSYVGKVNIREILPPQREKLNQTALKSLRL